MRRSVGTRFSGDVRICQGEGVRRADQLIGCTGLEGGGADLDLEGAMEDDSDGRLSRTSPGLGSFSVPFGSLLPAG